MAASDDAILELIFNPDARELPIDSVASIVESNPTKKIDDKVLKELQSLERQAVKLAEEGKLEEALKFLNQCIEKESDYASAYNNRAQVHRLMKNPELAIKDLDAVIEIGKGQAAILRQAYTQRGIIKRQQGDQPGAQKDFEMGAKYGNPLARNIAISENPFAKMCNQVMMEVMSREINVGRQ